MLHCIEVPNSQRITMKYSDRKKLYRNDGIYGIKTKEQEEKEDNLQYRKSHYPAISEQVGAIMTYLEGKPDITPELQELIDRINETKIEYPQTIPK